MMLVFFFFQAEDGIRDVERSRGLGDVYKRQDYRGIYAEVRGQLSFQDSVLSLSKRLQGSNPNIQARRTNDFTC